MPKFLSAFFKTLLFLLSFHCAFAQNNQTSVENSLVQSFNRQLANQSRLLNGVSYVDYAGKLDGNAFLYDNNDFVKATLVYDDIEYTDVPIVYDVVKDKVVTLLPNGYTKYSLLNDRLASFTLRNEKFIYFVPKDSTASQIPGFYKLEHEGQASVLVKYSKTVKEIVDSYGARKKFTGKVDYYILSNDKLQRVNRDSDIHKILGLDKGDLKQHLKAKNLKFRKQPEQTLVEAVSFLEQRK